LLLERGPDSFGYSPAAPVAECARFLYLAEPSAKRRQSLRRLIRTPFSSADYELIAPWLKGTLVTECGIRLFDAELLTRLIGENSPAVRLDILRAAASQTHRHSRSQDPKAEAPEQARRQVLVVLARESLTDASAEIRAFAARAAAGLQAEELTPLLLKRFGEQETETEPLVALAETLGREPFRAKLAAQEALLSVLERTDREKLIEMIAKKLTRKARGEPDIHYYHPDRSAPPLPAELMKRLGQPAVVGKLAGCKDATVRAAGAGLLGHLDSAAARSALAELAFDEDTKVQIAAVAFLQHLEREMPLERVIELSRQGGDVAYSRSARWREPAEPIRYAATVELARRDTLDALPALLERTTDPAELYPGGKAPCIPRIATAARRGVYLLTGREVGERRDEYGVYRVTLDTPEAFETWWQENKDGRRVEWLAEAFVRACAENRWPSFGWWGRRPTEGGLSGTILKLMTEQDARAWLAAEEPALQVLGLLYAKDHPDAFGRREDLLRPARSVLRHILKTDPPARRGWNSDTPKGLWHYAKAIEPDLLRQAALDVLFAADLQENDLNAVRSRILGLLSGYDDEWFERLGKTKGVAYEHIYLRTAGVAWDEADPKPDPEGLPPVRKAHALMRLMCETEQWDERLLDMLGSDRAEERHAAFFVLSELSWVRRSLPEAPAALMATARRLVNDPDPIVRDQCAGMLTKNASLAELFRYAEGDHAKLADHALKRLRWDHREQLTEPDNGRRAAKAVLKLCRSEEAALRAVGFAHAQLIRKEHADLYDRDLFLAALKDPDLLVRQEGLWAISRLGSPEDKEKLAILAGDKEGLDMLISSLDESTPDGLLKRIAPHLKELDDYALRKTAKELQRVADQKIARSAFAILLDEERKLDRETERALARLAAAVPGAVSFEEVLQLARSKGRLLCPGPWCEMLLESKDPRLVELVVAALSDSSLGRDMGNVLKKYLRQCGPDGWQVLADRWLTLDSYSRGTLLRRHLAGGKGADEFRAWLARAAQDPDNTGALCMALEFRYRSTGSFGNLVKDQVAIPNLFERAKALVEQGGKVEARTAVMALARLKPREAMELWKAIVAHLEDRPSEYDSYWYPFDLHVVLPENPDLRVPLFRERMGAEDYDTASRVLGGMKEEQFAEVKELARKLLDVKDPYRRSAATGTLIRFGDVKAAERFAEQLLAGEPDGSYGSVPRLMQEPKSEAVRNWIAQTDFYGKASLTKQGFSSFAPCYLREAGTAGVQRLLREARFEDAKRKVATLAVRMALPMEELLAIDDPEFVAACLEEAIERWDPVKDHRALRKRKTFRDPIANPVLDTAAWLIRLADSKDDRTACLALRLLSFHRDGNMTLRRHAVSPNPWRAANAVVALARYRDEADAAALAGALGHDSPLVRAPAAWMAGVSPAAERARQRLAAMAADAQEHVQVRSAALCWVRPAPELLASLVEHPRRCLATSAVRRAADLREQAALPALYRLAARGNAEEPDARLGVSAGLALETCGTREARILIANAIKLKALALLEEHRKPRADPRGQRFWPLVEELKGWIDVADRLKEPLRSTVLAGLLTDPYFGYPAAQKLLRDKDQGRLKLVVAAYRRGLAGKLPEGRRYEGGYGFEALMCKATGLELGGMDRQKQAQALVEFEATLPDPPEEIAGGWAVIPPPESALGEK